MNVHFRPFSLLPLLLALAQLGACAERRADAPVADAAADVAAEAPGAAATPAASTAENLLANGGFDDGAQAPWLIIVHADPLAISAAVDTDQFVTEPASLRLDATGAEPWAGIEQTIETEGLAGARLRFSAQVRGRGVTQAASLMVVFERGPFVQPIDQDFSDDIPDFDWRKIDVEFEVPDRVRNLRLGVLVKEGGSLWVDDIRLERIGD